MDDAEIVPANEMPFGELCAVLDNLYKAKKQKPKQAVILAKFINDFRISLAKITTNKNTSFFPILRLLIPKDDRERSAYNLKVYRLGVVLVNALSLSKTSVPARKLLGFKSVQDSDFAEAAFYVLKNRVSQPSGSLTVGDVNYVLDKIAAMDVETKRDDLFSYIIRKCSAEQIKWFIRIILKDLKLGMSADTILSVFHPDAPALFKEKRSLLKVCETLKDGNTRPLEMGIEVFCPVSPMLSERLDVTQVEKILSPEKIYLVENKFDGERFQMHMEKGVFKYFSRKGHNYSDIYGRTFETGLLTPHLKECFSASISSFILDGEMMAWHKTDQCFAAKGGKFDVKKLTDKSTFQPCFCVFDILYYNGKTLAGPPEKGGMPLKGRLNILDTMFQNKPGYIQHSVTDSIKNRTDILDALNKVIDDEDEGLVVKDIDSYYIPSRRNVGWYKIKPEYTAGTMEDLDLVVIGADMAQFKLRGLAKSFHVACADVINAGDTPHRWIAVGRVYSGLTYEERLDLCEKLKKYWVDSKRTSVPPSLIFNKKSPDFWIMPEHSIVLQVRATGLVRSSGHGTSYTMQFPRVVTVREDKPVNDVITLDEFNNIIANKGSIVKMATKHVNPEQIEVGGKIPKKRTSKVIEVSAQFRTKPIEVKEPTSKALLGRKICVIVDKASDKEELVKLVLLHSGKHVENCGPDTWCCVVNDENTDSVSGNRSNLTVRALSVIKSKQVDVTTVSWLRSLPISDTPCTISPLDLVSITRATRLKLCREYDCFGDSYTELVDEVTLKKCFQKMEDEEIYLTTQEILNIEQELFNDDQKPFSYLRPCNIYIQNNDILAIQAKMYGANICDLNSSVLSHAVMPKAKTEEELEMIKRNVNAPIVSEDWLYACFNEGNLVPVINFVL